MTSPPTAVPPRLALLAMLMLVTCLSQFYRVANSVIAPELSHDLGLTATDLGWAGAAFFLGLLALQIPVGIWLDRYGARRTVAALSLLTVWGALALAWARSPADIILARTLIGLGSAASFMSAVFLCSRWFPADRLASVLSWVFAASNIGTLAAASPLAWTTATVGWRWAFIGLALISAGAAALFFLVVRDQPPGEPVAERKPEPLKAILRGLLDVWRTAGLVPVLAMHTFAYATVVTVLGVWAGPYLYDVHGMASLQRGHALLAMGLAQICGILFYGPLDRIVGSRKKVVIGGVLATIAMLVALASLKAPPAWLAILLLVLVSFGAAYGIVIVAQGRALFPAHLAGRGVTTVNIAQVVGCAALPAASGYLLAAFTPTVAAAAPEIAYRAVFAFLAACNGAGLLVYLRATDSGPVATATPKEPSR